MRLTHGDQEDLHVREGAGTSICTSNLILGDEGVTGIDHLGRINVVDVTHGVDATDFRRRVAQAPGNGHSTEVRKRLREVDRRQHRQLEAPNSVVADIPLEPHPDGFHNILMQPVCGATAGEKDRDIIPGLPGLGVGVSTSSRLPDDRVERALALLNEPRLRLALREEPVERIDAEGANLGRQEGVPVGVRHMLIEPEHTGVEGHGTDVDEEIEARGVTGGLGKARHLRGRLWEYGDSEGFGSPIRVARLDHMRVIEEETHSFEGDGGVNLRELQSGAAMRR